MPRVKRGTTTHQRHANVLARAKGFRVGRRVLFRRASEALVQAGQFAYRDRRTKKRDFRRGWIVRINAAARLHNISYSTLMAKLTEAGSGLNRKVLAEMALQEPQAFEALVKKITS